MTVSARRSRPATAAVEGGAESDERLFERAVSGDPAGFAAFLARFEGRIARVVRALAPPGEAEDVFQEVCLRLVAKGRLYDPSRPLAPWIDAVTRQVSASAGRRRERDARSGAGAALEAEPAAPATAPGDPWVRDAVAEHMASLPAREREAIRLVFLSGLTQREAAKRLGVAPGTVATWCARSVRALRSRLGGDPDRRRGESSP